MGEVRVTVLVAEDQADLRRVVTALLSKQPGWTVVPTEDGDAALARARAQRVDLLVLDQRMPGLTGTQVARSLRDEDGFDGPIVLFSAYLGPEVEDEAAALGLVVLDKADVASLVDVVRRAIDDRRARGS